MMIVMRPAATDQEAQAAIDRVQSAGAGASEITHGSRTVLDIEGRKIGGPHFAMIAGTCTVESREQTLETARIVGDAGATLFRGGAYKPRTSPYAFHGLGIIVEVHPRPDEAICDAAQQLAADDFAGYLDKVRMAAAVAGKALWEEPVATRSAVLL